MDNAKELQRAELHKGIWNAAEELRNSVDGWDFKQYVLGMLFYRFVSENLTGYLNTQERLAGDPDFDYAQLPDEYAEEGRAQTVEEKGFYILPSELFENVRKRAKADENLNETLETVFRNFENSATGTDSEGDLQGLFDDFDVNSKKLGNTVAQRNQKLCALMDAIGNIDFGGSYQDNAIDTFGDAMEFLMTMYASSAGKSGGEFLTPQEVGRLLAKIALNGRTEINRAYDACCGSAGLLLALVKEVREKDADGKWDNHVRGGLFGQDVNLTMYNLARQNMFLHDVNFSKFDIALGDTLTEPQHWDYEPFDVIVSNVPFSTKWEGDDNPVLIDDERFSPAGVLAPKNNADLAFTMHMLRWLSVDGTAAIVQFPGTLYRGGKEQQIRSYMIRENKIDAVVQLPPNLFFGTNISTCILVLKGSKNDNDVLFIDASSEFVKAGNKNKLTPENIEAITKLYFDRVDVEYKAKLVSTADVLANDANLSVSSYVEKEDTREKVDIAALNARIAEIVAEQKALREKVDAIVADLEGSR